MGDEKEEEKKEEEKKKKKEEENEEEEEGRWRRKEGDYFVMLPLTSLPWHMLFLFQALSSPCPVPIFIPSTR